MTPKLSIIVISINDPLHLKQCLLAFQHQSTSVEILVVRDWQTHSNDEGSLKKMFSHVKWIDTPRMITVPKMRSLGIKKSIGEIVALLEDDCIVHRTWVRDLLNAHQSDAIAVGGAVEPSNYTKGIDWSIYFCEYGRFMQPFSGDVKELPGNHVSYKRKELEEFLRNTPVSDGFYDVFIHNVFLKQGYILKADPSLVVNNINSWTLANILIVPFSHGRGYACIRSMQWSMWQRYFFLVIVWILPIVLVFRIFKHIVSRRRYIFQFIWALPGITLFYISWITGEFVGCFIGPGTSLEQWR